MKKKLLTALFCGCAAALLCAPALAADDDDSKPKMTTKQIMKEAFKGGLIKKVAGGGASEEDTKKLHEMLVALSKNEPKKGEAESWKKLTTALVEAGKAAVEGDKKAGDLLKKSSNCKACHDKHK